ncbi:MAG: hypothetical protein V7L04_15095 [Nostoc sp.]|uniref:hypothetical protein n=1 Tax=Nostoc sp. TaxID=1180 RepID=UPI002FFB38C6
MSETLHERVTPPARQGRTAVPHGETPSERLPTLLRRYRYANTARQWLPMSNPRANSIRPGCLVFVLLPIVEML